MAFSESKLKSDILSVFESMRNAKDEQEKDWDKYFCDEISKVCKSFGETGEVTTLNDAGTVSSGVFKGSGKGSISLNDSLMSDPIYACCQQMKEARDGDDTVIARAIGQGLLAMTNAGVVTTQVTGVTTSPQGSTVPPSSGTSKGTLTCSNTDLIQGLIDCFKYMYDNYDTEDFDGDDYFAGEMASLTKSYFTAGQINTSGTAVLSGITATGTIA